MRGDETGRLGASVCPAVLPMRLSYSASSVPTVRGPPWLFALLIRLVILVWLSHPVEHQRELAAIVEPHE